MVRIPKLEHLPKKQLLHISTDNAKLVASRTAAFKVPSGSTCRCANECRSMFDRKKRKIIDGPNTKFRCYSASLEAARPSVRKSTDENLWKLLKAGTEEGMAELIEMSLPGLFWERIRIHDGGEFFSDEYFRAWLRVAQNNPNRFFYAYTKDISMWLNHINQIPDNFLLTASYGGTEDHLIEKHDLRWARTIFHPEDMAEYGDYKYPEDVDHDDSHARDPNCKGFFLLLHGVQPKGSEAAAAIRRLKEEDIDHTYGKKSKHSVT